MRVHAPKSSLVHGHAPQLRRLEFSNPSASDAPIQFCGLFGTPGYESLEEEAVKGLCWCIGNVLGGGSMLLKGFWHLDNPGDRPRSR